MVLVKDTNFILSPDPTSLLEVKLLATMKLSYLIWRFDQCEYEFISCSAYGRADFQKHMVINLS